MFNLSSSILIISLSISCGIINQSAEIPASILLKTSAQTKVTVDDGIKNVSDRVLVEFEIVNEHLDEINFQLDNLKILIDYIELANRNSLILQTNKINEITIDKLIEM
jgi:hypothetical protein